MRKTILIDSSIMCVRFLKKLLSAYFLT